MYLHKQECKQVSTRDAMNKPKNIFDKPIALSLSYGHIRPIKAYVYAARNKQASAYIKTIARITELASLPCTISTKIALIRANIRIFNRLGLSQIQFYFYADKVELTVLNNYGHIINTLLIELTNKEQSNG